MMRRVLGAATTVALLLALPACGKKTDETTRAAGITPASALGFLSVSLDPSIDQKRNLIGIARRFPDAEVKDDFEESRDDLLSTILEAAGLDYEEDVKPWLGSELALAVLPGTGGGPPLVAVLIEQDDEAKAKAAIDKANQQAEEEGAPPIAYRIVDDFVVATDGEDQALADQTIEAFAAQADKDEGDLSRSKDFVDVVDELAGDRLLLGWIDGPDALRELERFVDESEFPIEGLLGEAAPTAFDLHVARAAVVMEAVSRRTTESSDGRPELTESLPEDTFGAFTVFDVGGVLREALQAVFGTGGEPLAELKRQTGVDIEADLLSWMGGETVLVAAPAREGGFPSVGLVIEPTDRAAAEAAVPKIRAALAAVAEELEGVEPAVELFDDRVVLASSAAYAQELGRAASPSFGESDVYENVLGEAKSDATRMQLVLDIDAIRETVEAFLDDETRAEYEADTKPNVEPFDAIGMIVRRDRDFDRVEFRITFD